MVIHPASRSLIMRSDSHPHLIDVPSQSISQAGVGYTAVPCRTEVCRSLNLLGMWPQGPINLDYTWPGKFAPMVHQRITADFFTWHQKCFCFNQIGTGKTLAALWAADYLITQGLIRSVLVVTTLSTIRRAWADEITEHLPHLEHAVLHGSKAKRLDRLGQRAAVNIINHDGILVLAEELHGLIKNKKIGLVIVDEGAEFSNAQTDKFKCLKWLCTAAPDTRVWWLTGSPMPHAPTDVWSQARIICPDRVPQYYSHWRDATMRRVTDFKWAPKPDWASTVTRAVQPVVRFQRAACFDLPPTTYITRTAEMTPAQHTAYEQMRKTLLTEVQGKKINAVNEGVMLSKLVQITCGAVYTSESEIAAIGCAPKLVELDRAIHEAGGTALIFTSFRSSVDLILTHLKAAGHRAAKIDGGVSSGERDKIISGFQTGLVNCIVAHPKTMAHGLTLVRSSVIIWFGPPQSYRIYEQANGRITRPGQTKNTTILHVVCSDAERKIYARLQSSQELQGILLDLLTTKAV